MADGDRSRLSPRPLLYALPPLLAAAFLLWASREQTFYADEWAFFVRAAGFDAERLLEPHQGNLILSTVLAYKAVLSLFGADHHVGLRLLWVGLNLACAGLLFVLVRERVGWFAAAAAALVVVFFGAAWEFFGGSLGIAVFVCVGAGLGALVSLERRTRGGDALACLLVVVSLASLSTGLAFLAGVAATILIGPERWRRIWVAAVPLVLYAAWSLWARKYGQSEITVETLAAAPAAMVDSLASASAALFGAFRVPGPPEEGASNLVTSVNEEPGYLLGALLVAAAAWRVRAVGFAPRLVVPLTMLLAYWGSLSVVSPARIPTTGRYQYAAAIFILLLLAELWRGWRPGRGAQAGIAALALVAVVPNLANLGYATKFVREVSGEDRAKLAVADHLRERIDPGAIIQPPPFSPRSDLVISAEDYFRAKDEFGSPGYAIEELPGASPAARIAADNELVYLLGIGPQGVAALPEDGCRTLEPGEMTTGGGVEAPAAGFVFGAVGEGEVTLGLRRFGEDFYRFEPVVGAAFGLSLPGDGLSSPWLVGFDSAAPVRLCPLG